jgi:hypothetical protein
LNDASSLPEGIPADARERDTDPAEGSGRRSGPAHPRPQRRSSTERGDDRTGNRLARGRHARRREADTAQQRPRPRSTRQLGCCASCAHADGVEANDTMKPSTHQRVKNRIIGAAPLSGIRDRSPDSLLMMPRR